MMQKFYLFLTNYYIPLRKDSCGNSILIIIDKEEQNKAKQYHHCSAHDQSA